MRDFNFFQEKSVKEQQDIKQRYILLSVVIAFIALFGGLAIRNLVIEISLEKKINSYESFINFQDTKKKTEEYNGLSKKRDILIKYDAAVTTLDKNLLAVDNINRELIDKMVSAMPKKIYFKDISFEAKLININGTSADRAAIAEFEYNLKKSNIFEDVHVENIKSGENGEFTFSLTCSLKDEVSNEVH